MGNPFALIKNYWRILLSVTITEVKQRYAGSTLGKIWIVLNPLLFLLAYFFVFVSVLKIRLPDISTFDYVLIIFTGLIPWFGFSEAIGTGVGAVTTNASLIKNTLFPIELIPLKIVLSSSFSQLIGLAILAVILGIKGYLGVYALLLPVVLLLQLMFTSGLVWILSSLNVFFRDLGQMITVLLILLMMVSPIAYTVDMIDKEIYYILHFNPLFYMIMSYRDLLFYNQFPPLYISVTFIMLSLFTYYIGHYIFTRLKVVFSDYV